MFAFGQPLKQSILVREDSELDDFWRILGKKSEYPKERHTRLATEDPRLFTGSLEEGTMHNTLT